MYWHGKQNNTKLNYKLINLFYIMVEIKTNKVQNLNRFFDIAQAKTFKARYGYGLAFPYTEELNDFIEGLEENVSIFVSNGLVEFFPTKKAQINGLDNSTKDKLAEVVYKGIDFILCKKNDNEETLTIKFSNLSGTQFESLPKTKAKK